MQTYKQLFEHRFFHTLKCVSKICVCSCVFCRLVFDSQTCPCCASCGLYMSPYRNTKELSRTSPLLCARAPSTPKMVILKMKMRKMQMKMTGRVGRLCYPFLSPLRTPETSGSKTLSTSLFKRSLNRDVLQLQICYKYRSDLP